MAYLPGTDRIVKTFRITPADMQALRRGLKVAKATGGMVAAAVPSDTIREALLTFPDGLMLLIPPAAAAWGKRSRAAQYDRTGAYEPGSSEAALANGSTEPTEEESDEAL